MIDEIQHVPEFEDVLNSYLHIKNVDVYVTGSNARFLSNIIVGEETPILRTETGTTIMSIYDFLLKENSLDL